MATALLIGLFAIMAGCASGPPGSAGRSSGPAVIEDMDIAQIVMGKTTRSEVEARLGKPHRVVADADGREVYDYRFQGQEWEPGKFDDTQVYTRSVFALQPVNVPEWKSGRWKHKSRQLLVTLNADNLVDAVRVMD